MPVVAAASACVRPYPAHGSSPKIDLTWHRPRSRRRHSNRPHTCSPRAASIRLSRREEESYRGSLRCQRRRERRPFAPACRLPAAFRAGRVQLYLRAAASANPLWSLHAPGPTSPRRVAGAAVEPGCCVRVSRTSCARRRARARRAVVTHRSMQEHARCANCSPTHCLLSDAASEIFSRAAPRRTGSAIRSRGGDETAQKEQLQFFKS